MHRIAAHSILILILVAGCSPSSDPAGGREIIRTKGSDTLLNVAQSWAEIYEKVDKRVAVTVSGGGSGTGIAALINGTIDIANASRAISERERAKLDQLGFEAHEFIVGYDALSVVIHPNNPIDVFNPDQLAAIYGEGGEIDRWSQLGVEVPGCESDEIVRVSRQTTSGTYVYFKEIELGKEREYKLGSYDMHGSKDVVTLVKNTPCAIGYSGLAYVTDEVKKAALLTPTGDAVEPSIRSAIDGTYPISRPLYMYTREEPTGAIRAYLDWILSDDGQCIIFKKGYAPVRAVDCD